MVQPLFFEPDPSIEDSDLLGYGDLIFDNGTRQFINGDPEIAGALPRMPANDPLMDSGVGLGSSDPLTSPEYMPPPPVEMPQMPEPAAPMGPPPPPVQAEGMMWNPVTGQPMSPADFPGQSPYDRGEPIETEQGAMMGGPMESPVGMPPQGGAPPVDPREPVPIPGSPYQVIPATGEITPAGAGAGGSMGASAGPAGLQPFSREGALPADMAARQAAERAGMNDTVLQATLGARETEQQIYQMAALKRMGELDAEKQAQTQAMQEQQAKLQRLEQERNQVSQMDIKTDLVSAEGSIGAVFSILGAAALGYVGSDAGLRMIDSAIDQNVRRQINMRDTRLRALADSIGSSEQAISAAKATLYKVAADKAEATQQLTKADAFAAQTPEIVAQLRQKQLLEEQKFEQQSIGKTLEKAPVLALPKPAQVQGYGKAAADQTQSETNILRAAKALGLEGWDPQTKTFKNRDEVLQAGIPGVGTQDSFARDVGKLPVIGAIPQAVDNMFTSKEGLKVRAALESLVAAEAAAQNPGRAPTDADRDAARLSLGLTTEEGTVAAIERLMGQQEQAKAQNRATYGEGAARAYEQSIDASGTRRPAAGGPVDQGRPLQPGSAREQLQQYRQQGQQGPQGTLQLSPEQRMGEVAAEVQTMAGRELPPEGLQILTAQAAHETGDGASLPNNNAFGHKASGGRAGAALMTTEGEGSEAKRVRQNFATYGSLAESVTDHIDLLKRRYPEAWRALELGDAPAYVAALKDGGYFTGNETEYLNGIMRRL